MNGCLDKSCSKVASGSFPSEEVNNCVGIGAVGADPGASFGLLASRGDLHTDSDLVEVTFVVASGVELVCLQSPVFCELLLGPSGFRDVPQVEAGEQIYGVFEELVLVLILSQVRSKCLEDLYIVLSVF